MNDAWTHEWTTLQKQHEAYERSALLVKLLAVVLVAVGSWLTPTAPAVVAVLVLLLWAQEAIMKTWQARLGARLLVVEAALGGQTSNEARPFQLHTQWQAARAGTVGMLLEYAKSALWPTVAFPYAVLLVLSIFL
jgi:hypothetical protein